MLIILCRYLGCVRCNCLAQVPRVTQTILHGKDSDYSASRFREIRIKINDNFISFTLDDTSGVATDEMGVVIVYPIDGESYANNKWYNIIWTIENSQWDIYVNGIAHDNNDDAYPPVPLFNFTFTNLRIGSSTTGTNLFDGYLDDFRMYNRVLTPKERADILLYHDVINYDAPVLGVIESQKQVSNIIKDITRCYLKITC